MLKLRHAGASILLAGVALSASAQTTPAPKEKFVAHHATGTFEVKMAPQEPAPAEGTKRYSIDKTLHGGIEGTSKGEMLAAGDPRTGNAGYVALEVVTGTVNGKHGSFALQHSATMGPDGQHMNIIVSPGSGTGELKGIAGTFTIVIDNGKHSYDLDYTLPD